MKVSEKRINEKIEKSLKKTYIIKPLASGPGHINFPKCMVGMRVRIIPIKDKILK